MGEVLHGVEEGLGGHVMFGADAAFPMFRLMLKSRAATGGTGHNTLLGCNGLESVVRRATTTLADLGVSGGNGVCLTLLNAPKGDDAGADFVARFFVQRETKDVTTLGEHGKTNAGMV